MHVAAALKRVEDNKAKPKPNQHRMYDQPRVNEVAARKCSGHDR